MAISERFLTMRVIARQSVGALVRVVTVVLAVGGLAGCVVYEPRVPYYAPTPTYSTTATPAPADQTCREYQTTATIDGKPQQLHGTACLRPDGTWQFMH
jgi:hypothetical protein